jgi:threonine synthase
MGGTGMSPVTVTGTDPVVTGMGIGQSMGGWGTVLIGDYVSTRGSAPPLRFLDSVVESLARDGGLLVPRVWPRFSWSQIRALQGLPYEEVAFRVMWPFTNGEVPEPVFREMIRDTYAQFPHPEVTPLVKTGDQR